MIHRVSISHALLCSIFLGGCLGKKQEQPAAANTSAASTLPAAPSTPQSTPSGVQKTYSGLQYEVLREGTGRRPTIFNKVKVHYHGYLPNGTVFDSSVQRGTPAVFGLDNVIAGWREGIPLMREGSKYRFTIPPHLAYGEQGSPPTIGPNQTLKFDVELLQIVY